MGFLSLFGAALLLGAVLTPLLRRVALRVGLVDEPDGHRKLHHQATPLGGGVAILLAACLTIAGSYWYGGEVAAAIARQPRFSLGLLGAGCLICFVGLLDDALSLRGRQKLVAQVVAVLLIVVGGLQIERVELFGWQLELGLLAVPATIAWLLGAVNALNLIDGIDGLAGTVGVILSVTVAGLSVLTGHTADAAFACALAGGILGFLVYNLPPARIYMGDAGSMTIGLILGALAIRSSLKGPTTVAMAAPAAIWAVLMFDVLMAILRRKLTGQSVYTTDRAHLHHALQRSGYSGLAVVLLIGTMCALCAAGAIASVYLQNELVAVGTCATVLAALVSSGYFGRSECGLLLRRGCRLASSLCQVPRRNSTEVTPIVSRFHGNRDWERLWKSLVEYAERFDLSIVQLNISSPSIGEEYHAAWERKSHPPLNRLWRTEIPVFMREISVGRLTVMGGVNDGEVVTWMSDLMEGLRPFEVELTSLLDETSMSSDAMNRHRENTATVNGTIVGTDTVEVQAP